MGYNKEKEEIFLKNTLKLSDNIARLRKEKKITQEALADFIGVTKASVSKWETGQSLPDILILPQLAAYFDVTVDELLGYEAQLTRTQIQKLYEELAADYANQPFAQVTERTQSLVHRYYSCYPFLLQIVTLWLNHAALAGDQKQQKDFLEKGAALCGHIIQNCSEVAICNDAIALKALFDLQLGNAAEVILALEGMADPAHLWHQTDLILASAYMAEGENDKAYSHTQFSIYIHVLSLVSSAVQYLAINMGNMEICEKTIQKTEGLIRLFDLDTLHPNAAAQFYYQAAIGYAAQKQNGKALEKLGQYERAVRFLLEGEHVKLHGDAYFDRLEEWINRLELGAMPPRNMQLVARSVVQTLEHPLFGELRGEKEFQRIQKSLQEGAKRYE